MGMKGFQKHKVQVGRHDYVTNSTTWYWIDAMVQPLKKVQGFDTPSDLFSTYIDGHILWTKNDKPTIIEVDETPETGDLPIPRADVVWWDNKWYYVFGEADYIKFSNGTHRKVQLDRADLSGTYSWLVGVVPPAFATEYDAFTDAVGQVATVIELGLLPISNPMP